MAENSKAKKGGKSTKARKKIKKIVNKGIAHIKTTFNNTMVTITDTLGNTLCRKSCAQVGFKGARKSTPFAAQSAAEAVSKEAFETFGMKSVDVRVKGPGSGRESAVRGINAGGLEIDSIEDTTPIAHNGCRPPKKRRV